MTILHSLFLLCVLLARNNIALINAFGINKSSENDVNNSFKREENMSGSSSTPLPTTFLKSSYSNILHVKGKISSMVDPLLPPPIRLAYNLMKNMILYKPPVGIAAFYIAYHWLFKRQSFSIIDSAEHSESRKRKQQKAQRNMDLDVTDREYDMYGGIESTRVELCRIYIDYELTHGKSDDEILYYIDQALSVSCPPRSSRELFVEKNVEFLDRLFLYGLLSSIGSDNIKRSNGGSVDEIVRISARVIEMRVLDALLRILRDRLLLSAKRLEKNERYWSWRVRWYEGRFRIGTYMKRVTRQFIFRATLDEDRHQLSLSQALLTKEIERLGIVQKMLLSRPFELSKTMLLDVPNKDNIEYTKALLQKETSWLNLACDWTCEARLMLYNVISNSTTSSSAPPTPLSEWSTCARGDKESWIDALATVDNLPKARRDALLSDFTDWFKQVDFKGVPSSLATLIASLVIHETLKPRWSIIVATFLSTSDIVKGILDRRFYTPVRDIVLDLMNRRPRLLDPFALQIEETSLENMLRDLGIVDSTAIYDRAQVLTKMAGMYEEELRNGPIRGVFRGQMVRLLLIQIQQLKTDLLVAMGTIDDLVDANRLNVQLLASIPSVLLVVLGTRLFFIILYSLKSRDIFPTIDVHAKMSDYLYQMERCLILSDANTVDTATNDVLVGSTKQQRRFVDEKVANEQGVFLKPLHLGEFLLLVHKYLLLLDFSTPPISSKVSDAIHRSMQDLMQQGQLNTSLQLSLLRLIRSKHEELEKSL